MKNRKIFLLAVTAFLISSCGGNTNSSDSSSTNGGGTTSSTSAGDNSSASSSSTSGGDELQINYGTLDNPLSVSTLVSEATKLNLEEEEFSPKTFFVKAYALKDSSINSEYNNYETFQIGDTTDAAYADQFYVKRAVAGEGVDGFKKGDTLTIEGYVEMFETHLSLFPNGDVAPIIHKVTSNVEPTPTPTITDVTITNNIGEFYVGETTYELSASVEGTGEYNKYVTFTVKDPSIIEVEVKQNHPYIKALKAGTTELIATANGDSTKSASTTITVLNPFVTSIDLSLKGPLSIEKNKTVSLTATVNGKGNHTNDVTWSASNDNIISFGTGNAITIKGEHVGTTKLTAKADEVTTCIDINVVADFDYSLKMSYDLVSSQDDLVINERYILVAKDKDKAMSSSFNSGGDRFTSIDVTRDSLNDKRIVDIVGNDAFTFLLRPGNKENTYALDYKDKVLQPGGDNNVKLVNNIDDSTSWTLSVVDGIATISILLNNETWALKYNTSGSLFSAYKSTSLNMTDLELYKYSSGREQIEFPYEDGFTLSSSQKYTNQLTVHGFEPASISYTSSDNSVASISGTTENFTIVTTDKGGDVSFTAEALDKDGKVVTSASIKFSVETYSYTFTDSKYAIAKDSTLFSPTTGKATTTYDIENSAYYFTFEKAYQGDNSFYISNGNQYVKTNDGKARVTLQNSGDVWTIVKEDDEFYIYTTISGKSLYLQPASGSKEGSWYIAVEGKVSINLIALPTFKEIKVDSTNLKNTTYNYDETFDPTGLIVSAVYTSSLGERIVDITNKISWSTSFGANSIDGKVTISGTEKTVTVAGLTITHFDLDNISLNCEDAITSYVVGDKVDISGVVITATDKDGEDSRTRIIDNSKVTYSPTTISEDTTQITITYEGKSASYPVTVASSSFVEVDHLHKGFHVVFGGNVNGQNYEVVGNGVNSIEFNDVPVGQAVFEIEEVSVDKSDDLTIHTYRFKLIEVADEAYKDNIGKYLAYDGKDGKRATMMNLESDTEGKTLFIYSTNVSGEGFSLLSKNLNKPLTLIESGTANPKFGFNGDEVTIYYDSSIDYE